jgi:hypothetical protein
MIDHAILALQVLYWGLMVFFLMLLLMGSISGLAAGVLGLTACAAALGERLLRRKRKQLTSV